MSAVGGLRSAGGRGDLQEEERDQKAAATAIDGRSSRRDRNRTAVLEAAIALFCEGRLTPGPIEVADRCGLSPRSVYRYFEDSDQLLAAAVEHHMEQVLPYFHIHAIGRGPRRERIERFVAARLELFEVLAQSSRAARLLAVTNPEMRGRVEMTRAVLRDQADRHFAAEFALLEESERAIRQDAVDALCQLDSLDYQRHLQGKSPEETAEILHVALDLLLPTEPDTEPDAPVEDGT